jgi:hypothetical protein
MNEYKNIEKITPKTLLTLTREVLDQSVDFLYISGIQPFFISFQNKKYYVYIKNISSAYFSDRDKTTRAQLPIKKEFDSIKSSPYPFIFLGYDGIYDVFVCWNFHIVKERLNNGKSVSFYSRTFFQSQVKEGEFIRRKLKNGDLPVLFKRSGLIDFFKNINTFFDPVFFKKEIDIEVNSIYNHEENFKIYLKENKKLSDKSIKNYSNALKNKITSGIRKYFISNIDSIYFINNISILEDLKIKLFETQEYIDLNLKGKNMYSCAFDNYINFIRNKVELKKEVSDLIVNEKNVQYTKNNKLHVISDLKLIKEIEPYIKSNRLLSASQIVSNFYKEKYPEMDLNDWISLVRSIKY